VSPLIVNFVHAYILNQTKSSF